MISDLLIGMVTIPSFTMVHHAGIGLATQRNACLTSYVLSHCPTAVSLLTLFVIAIERFVAIHHPFSYHRFFTNRNTGVLIALIWLYTWTLLPTLWFSTNHWRPEMTDCNFTDISSVVYIAVMCGHLLFVFIACAVLHGSVAFTAWKHRCRIRVQAQLVNADTRVQRDAKVARMLALVLGIFYLCWLPYFLTLPFALGGMEEKEPMWFHVWEQFSGMVLVGNSFLNPLIYAWKDVDLRQCFKKVLRRDHPVLYETFQSSSSQQPCRSTSTEL